MSRLRVCFLCNEYPPGPHGGIGSSTQVLARGLVEAGHKVRVIGMYSADYPAPDYEEDRGVRVWRLRRTERRWDWPHARYAIFRTAARWARQGEIDLVDAPDWEGWTAGWPRLPIPVIVRLCGSSSYFAVELGQPLRRTLYWLERSALARADYWCSKSVYTADRTRRLFRLRSEPRAVLYNPVELPERPPHASRNRHQVVFTGTLTEKKGILSLIRVWPQVHSASPEAQLHVFGKDGRSPQGGSMQQFLQGLLDSEVAATVHFHGHVGRSEVMDALARSRVAVFPSYVEAFANAPLEAMACGCPTIYSCRGSGPELIEDGCHGLLVAPDDSTQIVTALLRLLYDDELASQLGLAGLERVRARYSLRTIVPQNVDFYRSCITDLRS